MREPSDRIGRLLRKVEATWEDFQASYAGLSEADLMEPGVVEGWSVRDLIAHVTWWDEEAIRHLPLVLEGERPPRYADRYGGIDAFNAMQAETRRDLSLAEVRDAAEETHRRLIAYLEGVPTERLAGNERFTRRLRLDTYGHYPIHAVHIRQWRATRDGAS